MKADEQVNMALPNEQPGSDVNSTNRPQNAAVGVVRDKTLTGDFREVDPNCGTAELVGGRAVPS
jgi:hypothetical protein